MEYPGSVLTRKWRRGLLCFFIATFLITTPIIVLYTSGYRYDWHNGLLKQTGALSLDMQPRDAELYINNERIIGLAPFRFKNIAPGHYHVRLTATGYYSWEKEIDIREKQTTYLKDIELIAKSRAELIAEGPITQLFLSPDERTLLYALPSATSTAWHLLDTPSQQSRVIFRGPSTQNAQTAWAKKQSFAAWSMPGTTTAKLAIANTNEGSAAVVAEIENGSGFYWQENGAVPLLYYRFENQLITYNPLTGQHTQAGELAALDWSVYRDQIWTLTQTSSTAPLIITKDALGFSTVFGQLTNDALRERASELEQWRLELVYEGGVLLKNNATNQLYILSEAGGRLLPGSGTTLLSPFGNWLLWWNDSELWSYLPSEEPQLLKRSGERLQAITPLDTFNTLALATAQGVKALFPYYLVETELPISATNLVAAVEQRWLYVVGSAQNKMGLWKLAY